MGLRQFLRMSTVAAVLSATTMGGAWADTWRIQALFTPGDRSMVLFKEMAKEVKDATKGAVDIEVFAVDQVVGAGGTLDAINKAGVIDGHFSWPGLWAGKEPAFSPLADLPGGYLDVRDQQEFWAKHGGLDMLRDLYAPFGAYTVGVVLNGIESLPSRKPIRSVEDLKGMKIRLPGGLTSQVFVALGASPVKMPLSEAFSALDKGVVDAADAGTLSDNLNMGMYDKAQYTLYPGLHSAVVLDFTVNKKKWNALSDANKAILEGAMAAMADRLIETRDADDAVAAGKLREEGKVELIDLPAKERAKFRAVAKSQWLEYAKQSEKTARAVQAQIDFLSMKGLLD